MRWFANPPTMPSALAVLKLIQRVDGGYVAGSDPRKDGQAVGY
jgi:hypothetical protein